MKKYFIVLLTAYLINFTFCSNKESRLSLSKGVTIKIKAGIIMKSGDIKDVARQDFIIARDDLVAIWKLSKMQNMRDILTLQDELKKEINFDYKMVVLQKEIEKNKNEIDRFRKNISSKTKNDDPLINRIIDLLATNLKSSFNLGLGWANADYFRFDSNRLGQYRPNYEELKNMLRDYEKKYEEILKMERGEDYKKVWKNQYDKFKEIEGLFLKKESEISTELNGIKVATEAINKLNEEKELLPLDMKRKAQEKYKSLKHEATLEFQEKLKNSYISSFKTNLNGEASVKINKGKYYLFAVSKIGLSTIMWNYPITIEKEGQYIELSNDNAYSINNEDLINEITEALAGLGLPE